MQTEFAQRAGGEAGGVTLVADDDEQVEAGRLGRAVRTRRIDPPLQFVALDDQGAGDGAVGVAQCGVADVDQQRALALGAEGGLGGEPVEPLAGGFQKASRRGLSRPYRALPSFPLPRALDLLQPQQRRPYGCSGASAEAAGSRRGRRPRAGRRSR